MSRERLIQETAERLLATGPAAPVRVRLLRDVLGVPPEDADLTRARADLAGSYWVRLLAKEQRDDGGWGRFHSMDTRLRQRHPTTEVAVQRALALGLDGAHPVLARASRYLRAILRNEMPFPDPPEKNDRWATGTELFAAGTLAMIEPDATALAPIRARWAQIVQGAFEAGSHDLATERDVQRRLHGIASELRYLALFNRYQVTLLASEPTVLAAETLDVALDWLWRRPHGIGYLGTPLSGAPGAKRGLDRWLHSHWLLSAFGAPWRVRAREMVAWLLAARGDDGLWDLGQHGGTSGTQSLPLSKSWRAAGTSRIDWSTRVLLLLARVEGMA